MADRDRQVAVVTGAASGIGAAAARQLAGAGAQVALADVDTAGALAQVADIEAAGGVAHSFSTDVCDASSVVELATSVHERFGAVSVLVNAAGWDMIEPFVDNTPEYWDRVVALNFMGPVRVCRAFLDDMIDARRGAIVNVASDAGRVGSLGESVYAGAKGGVIAFTKSLAREVARYGISVNAVSPGPTDTPLFASQPVKMQEALVRAIPMRRVGTPAEVAAAIAFLGQPDSYVTGQVLSVSGGLTMVG